jgi:hypothetical protein
MAPSEFTLSAEWELICEIDDAACLYLVLKSGEIVIDERIILIRCPR